MSADASDPDQPSALDVLPPVAGDEALPLEGADDASPPNEATRSTYLLGFGLSVFSAVTYSCANVALRQLADNKSFDWAIFVTACKAIGASTVAWILIARSIARGRSEFPAARHWPALAIAAVCTHVIGNLLIQYAFALGGIALVVPIVFSMIIVTGATLGWLVLGERVSKLLLVAIVLLISAIAILGFGADEAAASAAKNSTPAKTLTVILTAVVAGMGYGCVGVVVRRTRMAGVSSAGTLVLISTSGVVVLGTVALFRLGYDGIASMATPRDLFWIAVASCCNAAAFFAIAESYQRLPVVRVNLINSSQSAMCALAGVFIFAEPATPWLIYGTLLTLAGLTLVGLAKERS